LNGYTFHITIYGLLALGTIFVGLTFFLLLWFTKRNDRAANRFLSLALLTVVLRMVSVLSTDMRLATYFQYWYWLPPDFSLALGPLIYFYVLKRTRPGLKFRRKDLLHFIPTLLQQVAFAFSVRVNPVLRLAAFISVMMYLFGSFRLIERFYQDLKFNELSDRYRYQLRWLRNLLTGFGLLWLLWIPLTTVDYFYYSNRLGIEAYFPLYLLLAVMAIWMAAVAFLRAEAGVPPDTSQIKSIAPVALKQKANWLKKAVKEHGYYLDPELSLPALAEKLKMPVHELSRIINVALKKNFNDFINEYRVTDVIKKIKDTNYDHITLLGIALESGFSSQSTFTRIFKQMTGKSPVEYKNELKKDCPSYKSGSEVKPGTIISYHKTTQKWSPNKLTRNYMFRNYFKIAWRNLSRRRAYALLNIFGLAIGMACFLMIIQYVAYEKSYDRFNRVAKDIVRVRLDGYQQGNLAYRSATSYPAIGPTAKKELPDVEDYCRLYNVQQLMINEQKNVKFNELKGYYADPSVVSMLGLQLVKGDPKEVLNAVDKMIVSQSFARKYFGNSDPVGKTLVSKDPQVTEPYIITGVFKDYPPNSHLVIDYIISYATLGKIKSLQGDTQNTTETGWFWYDFYTYLQLKPGTDLKKFDARLTSFCEDHINSLGKNKGNHFRAELHVVPLTDIHLYSNANQEAEINGSGQVVSFLLLIGIFIILIAWINYINLATARAVERAKEVGVRKVLGAGRLGLVRQFLTESFMLNLIALVIAFITAYLLTPAFNHFVGREMVIGFSLPWTYLAGFLALFLALSFFSGIYPAFVLSGYQPVKVLKGNFKNTGSGVRLRKALITGQFITSVVLVAGTIIVYQQVSFMRSQKLGANIDQTLVIQGAASLRDTVYSKVFQPFKQDLLNMPNVKSVTASSNVMGQEIQWSRGVRRLAGNTPEVTLYNLGVDYDFIPSFGIGIKAGRNFSKDFANDKKTALLNEDAAKLLGFKDAESAINQKIWPYDTLTIIGVVANFHQEGLKKSVQPMILLLRPDSRDYYAVKVGTDHVSATVAAVKNVWDKYFPSDPFNYSFLDESFNRQYQSEELFGSIFAMFALIAILIACFGLAGLSAYNILQRRKEIGIRKVIGASVQQLLSLLVNDFLRLVIVAFFISIPLTWIAMNQWLQGFAYRIHISWLVFAIAGSAITVIVVATISFQAVKAATANPVKSLRVE